jgi:hypothetical protein
MYLTVIREVNTAINGQLYLLEALILPFVSSQIEEFELIGAILSHGGDEELRALVRGLGSGGACDEWLTVVEETTSCAVVGTSCA